jgi:hypothetical protein
MYRQQFYIIANFLMVLDTFIVIFTGYVAYSVTKRRTDGALVRLEMPLRQRHPFFCSKPICISRISRRTCPTM